MRYAVPVLLLLLAFPITACGDPTEGPIDAVGMIDYSHGPHFKVGDWVRYRTKGSSYQGYRTDYTVTMLIGGEEMWWGEKCFWVETQVSFSGGPPQVAGSLVSYEIFQDSLPSLRFTRYLRKIIDGKDENGYTQQPFRRALEQIRSRTFAEPSPPRKIDTLGVESVTVPKGSYDALKVKQLMRQVSTTEVRDSTIYFEVVQDHTYWWSDQVPITRLVKIAQDNIQRRRAWMVGESANAPLVEAEHGTGGTELLDCGSGMKAISVPERFQRPISEQVPAKAKPAKTQKPASKRG